MGMSCARPVPGPGYSDADRAENLRRSAEVARIALMSNLCVIAAFITPLEAHRKVVAEIIGPDRLSPGVIDASLECAAAGTSRASMPGPGREASPS